MTDMRMTDLRQSRLLQGIPGVVHGFGDRSAPIPRQFAADWERLRVRWKQVHGVGVAEVSCSGQECGEVDALFTMKRGLPVAVVTADCVPLLFARRSGGAVAAVHAGWRGTRAHIVQALWERLLARGERPSEWVAAIGPSIGPCCYQVSEELALDFSREFAALGTGVAIPSFRKLDLPAINAAELERIGLSQVELIRACTQCGSKDGSPCFFSYRRGDQNARQWSIIMLASESARTS